jgi:hypothetical protein
VLGFRRCTLETFDPLGLQLHQEGTSVRDSSQSPLSTHFGILSLVFGSSSGDGTRRGVAGYPVRDNPFISVVECIKVVL